MAHFAKLDSENKVLEILVVNNDVILINGIESEEIGIQFLQDLTGHENWKQTSYNANFRKNYAVIGGIYSEELNAFIPKKPNPNSVLDPETCKWI